MLLVQAADEEGLTDAAPAEDSDQLRTWRPQGTLQLGALLFPTDDGILGVHL
jgi:hypothetical protein